MTHAAAAAAAAAAAGEPLQIKAGGLMIGWLAAVYPRD